MSLTIDEILELQAKILSARTDSTTNPNMTYSSIPARNKALNPEYFSGNDTKIVNALNTMYKTNLNTAESTKKITDKFNNVVLDTETYTEEWDKLKELMKEDTIVEGLINLYENKLPNESSFEYVTTDEIDSIINNLK